MEQRAAGGDDELLRAGTEPLEQVERVIEVVDPDVPAVDDPGEQPLVARPSCSATNSTLWRPPCS
jgi:hypothetical protein